MALDVGTQQNLVGLQETLQAKLQGLRDTITQVQGIEDAAGSASLTIDEMLAVKNIVFPNLPQKDDLIRQVSMLELSLSGIQKLLAVQ